MYVPGAIKKVDKVLVDIGTGYYAEMVRFPNYCTSYMKIKIYFASVNIFSD